MLCPKCKKENHHSAAMCEFCGADLTQAPAVKKENFFAGIVGAVLGSLLGAASIILFDQINFVASLSGLVLAVCTLKGYALLGGKLSKKGVVFCIILMLLVPWFANQASTALLFMRDVADTGIPISFAKAYAAVPKLIGGGYEYGMYIYSLESDSYYIGLVMIYGFAVLGAFSTVKSALKG